MDIIKDQSWKQMDDMIQEVLEDMLGIGHAKEVDVFRNVNEDFIRNWGHLGQFRYSTPRPSIHIPAGPMSYEEIPIRRKGVHGPPRPPSMLDDIAKQFIKRNKRTLDLDDVRYILAHETGHAKDFFERGGRNVDIFDSIRDARKELLADKHGMNWMASKGHKLGEYFTPTAQLSEDKLPWGKKHFPRMARSRGIIPMLLMGLIGSMSMMGEE